MIKVTAENGAKKEYKINAYVAESPQIYAKYEDGEVGIFHKVKELKAPEGFTPVEQKIDDKLITVYENGIFAMVYGVNEKEERNFYLFDKEQNSIISLNTLDNEVIENKNIPNYIIYAISAVFLLIILFLIILLFKQRKGKTNEANNQ